MYKARDTRLNRTVAIKVLSAHFSDNAEMKAPFEREDRQDGDETKGGSVCAESNLVNHALLTRVTTYLTPQKGSLTNSQDAKHRYGSPYSGFQDLVGVIQKDDAYFNYRRNFNSLWTGYRCHLFIS